MTCHIALLAKAPIAGFAKTRLIPVLGEQGAAALHQRLLEHQLNQLQSLVQNHQVNVTLWRAGDQQHPFWHYCAEHFSEIAQRPQSEGDLGARMHACIQTNSPSLIIGSDCPLLTTQRLSDALHALQKHPVVINPAEDGGYVLIGLQQADPLLFKDMPWGTDRVMSDTRQRLSERGLSYYLCPTLWDVDEPQDYQRLLDCLPELARSEG